jgi:hypothetical protein
MMRAIRASLLPLLAAASVIAGIAIVFSLMRSPWGYDPGPGFIDQRTPTAQNTSWFFASADGSLRILRQRVTTTPGGSPRLSADGARLGFLTIRSDGNIISRLRHGEMQPTKWRLGLGWEKHRFGKVVNFYSPGPIGASFNLDYTTVAIPYWLLLLPTLVAPWMIVRQRWTRLRREELGLCLQCGYDLRETPERCPECGAIPPAEGRW